MGEERERHQLAAFHIWAHALTTEQIGQGHFLQLLNPRFIRFIIEEIDTISELIIYSYN